MLSTTHLCTECRKSAPAELTIASDRRGTHRDHDPGAACSGNQFKAGTRISLQASATVAMKPSKGSDFLLAYKIALTCFATSSTRSSSSLRAANWVEST